MSVVKRGNSKYWYVQFQMNGRTVIKSTRTTSKKAAEQFEADLRSKMHAQIFLGVKPSITLGEALDRHCDSRRGTPFHRGLCSSAKLAEKLLGKSKRLDELTSHDLERFKRARMAEGISQQTIKHNLNVVRGAMKSARLDGFSVADLVFPTVSVSRPQVRYLSADEESQLLTELDPGRQTRGLPLDEARREEWQRWMQDNYDIVQILLDTGARYSEIATIEWRRIDLAGRAIHLWRSKVQNESILYMTDRVHDILTRRKATSLGLHVFTSKNGGPRGYATQSIRKAIRRADLGDVKIHTLRHTHASRLIQNGMSVYEVQEVLGHSDIKTTMRYAHLEARHVTAKARDVINRLNSKMSDPRGTAGENL